MSEEQGEVFEKTLKEISRELPPTLQKPPQPDVAISPRIEVLQADAEKLASEALSESTRRCYASDWKRWNAWCASESLDPLGPSGQLALYIAHLVNNGAKVATIDRAVSAISKAYTLAERPNPRQDPAVKLVYRGARRRIGVAPEQVEAILPSQLKLMVENLPKGIHQDLRSARNRAALVMGWAGGFRRSELLGLNMDDVSVQEEGLRVKILKSKTDQEGRGRIIGLPYASVAIVCPVRSFLAWKEAADIDDGPLFRRISRDGRSVEEPRLSTRQFSDIVKSAAKRANLDGRFSGHSLRAGLVTSAVQAKKNPKAIMQQTGHKTVAMIMRYVREQGVWDDNAATGLL